VTVSFVPEASLRLMGYKIPFHCGCRMKWLGWIRSPMNIIDLLTILPFFVIEVVDTEVDSIGDGGFQLIRIVRLTRVFRVFKLGKYSEGLALFGSVIKKSLSALYLLFFFMLISMIIFGSTIYYAERGEWNEDLGYYTRPDLYGDGIERTPFESIPKSFWWVIVTSTTVGYGDMVPRTLYGQIVGTIAMYFGILVLAMPMAIMSSNFQKVHEEHMMNKHGYHDTASSMSGKMLEMLISLESANAELSKIFQETKTLCERYLQVTGPEKDKVEDSYDQRRLLLEEFRSLQSQLRIILTYKKSVIVRIQRFANMLIRDKKKTQGR